MALFEQFPYTNFHNLNLDWLLKQVKSQGERITTIESTITDIQTDFIAPWNSTKIWRWHGDGDGGGLCTPDENLLIRDVKYNLTGRVLQYFIAFYTKEGADDPLATSEITLPAWIKATPLDTALYIYDEDVQGPVYKAHYIWRKRDNGQLFLRNYNLPHHLVSTFGYMVLEDLSDVPEEMPGT